MIFRDMASRPMRDERNYSNAELRNDALFPRSQSGIGSSGGEWSGRRIDR